VLAAARIGPVQRAKTWVIVGSVPESGMGTARTAAQPQCGSTIVVVFLHAYPSSNRPCDLVQPPLPSGRLARAHTHIDQHYDSGGCGCDAQRPPHGQLTWQTAAAAGTATIRHGLELLPREAP
jgi:hypothetical protein